jgi:transcriptional regulator GlxA family with amidase domain
MRTSRKPSASADTTRVYVVLTPGVLLLDLGGIAEPLRLANTCSTAKGLPAPFELHIVSCDKDVRGSLPLMLSALERLPANLGADAREDWVILVGVATHNDVAPAIAKASRRTTVAWLKEVVGPALAANQARLWTVCSGALLAADAGLLDGRRCTTHHELTGGLRNAHPDAEVLEDRIFVIDDRVATSAGVTAGIDLALAAITERCGPAIAGDVARDMVVYWRRAGGDPQLSPLVAHRNHLHPAVHRAQQAVLARPDDAWDVERLAQAGHVSVRHMRRLFVEHAGITPLAYVNGVRVALARQMLSSQRMSVESAAEKVGFASARQLRDAWSKVAEDSPRQAKAPK